MSLSLRLQKALDDAKLTQEALAKLVGMTQQGIQAIIAGESRMPRKLNEIAHALGVTPAWLQYGDNHLAQPQGTYTVDSNKYALIPKYRVQGAMGAAIDNGHEEVSGTHAYRRDWLERKRLMPAQLVVIDAVGDSMHPTICDGDVVLIDTGERRLANGLVFAFRHEDGPRIKRLFKQLDGRIRIVSDNADKMTYPDEFLTPGMDAEIIGRVVHRSGEV